VVRLLAVAGIAPGNLVRLNRAEAAGLPCADECLYAARNGLPCCELDARADSHVDVTSHLYSEYRSKGHALVPGSWQFPSYVRMSGRIMIPFMHVS